MSYFNHGETNSPIPSRQYSLIIEENRKSSAIAGRVSFLSRFAPHARIQQRAMPASIGIANRVQSSPLGRVDTGSIPGVPAQDVPVLVFLGSFLVYFLTAAPTLFGWDSGEYAATAYKLGVPHATGYPVYVLIGKLFTYAPFGDVAYRLNLMSALFASGTVTVVYLISFLVTGRAILSVAAAGSLAFSYFFWSSAVVAEVYSLHAFLNATTIYLLLQWNRGGRDWLLYGGVFIWGLSFGNHMTTVLMGPAIAYLIGMGLWKQRLSWRHLLPVATCFLVPLGVYLYLPLRYLAEAVPYVMSHYTSEGVLVRTDTTTLAGMWEVLTARQFADFFGVHQGADYWDQLGRLMFSLYANFLGVGLALGMAGIVRNFLVDKERLVFFGLVFLANILFFGYYGAMDKTFMFVTGFVVWAVWMAEGLTYIFSIIANSLPGGWQERFRRDVGPRLQRVRWEALAVLLPVAGLWINYSYADLSSFTHIRDTYPRVMQAFEPNALVLAWWADLTPMQYYQQVENVRPDIQLVDRFLISHEDELELIDKSLPHRPVYVFEGYVRNVPHQKREVPALWGTIETGHRIIPP